MRQYEIMFVIKPTLSDDEIIKIANNFKDIITNNGAVVLSSKELGQKELAYEIKDFKTGYYFLIIAEANDDKAIKEFDRLSLISNDVIRHLITKLEN